MNPNTHLYLYAKGHYQCGDVMADLRIIIGKRAHMDSRLISNNDIWSVLLPLVHKAIVESGNPENAFCEFVRRTMSDGIVREVVAYNCLSVLRLQKVAHLDLGEADPNVLPLSQQEAYPS